MSNDIQYSPEFAEDGKWIIATCREFPEANGQGKTEEEAEASLLSAINALLDHDRIKSNRGY